MRHINTAPYPNKIWIWIDSLRTSRFVQGDHLSNGDEVGDLLPTRRLEFGPDLRPGTLLADGGHRETIPVLIDLGRGYDRSPMNALTDLSWIQIDESPDGPALRLDFQRERFSDGPGPPNHQSVPIPGQGVE